jgi:hypothetical protein
MKATKPNYYPDPVIFDKERMIYARFDGSPNPSAFNVPIYFSNDDILKNKVITGISVASGRGRGFTSGQIQTDLGFIGTLVSTTGIPYFTITLVGKNGQVILNDCPLMEFQINVDNGKIRRTSIMIDMSKSYIRNLGLAGVTAQSIIPISFYYKDR